MIEGEIGMEEVGDTFVDVVDVGGGDEEQDEEWRERREI